MKSIQKSIQLSQIIHLKMVITILILTTLLTMGSEIGTYWNSAGETAIDELFFSAIDIRQPERKVDTESKIPEVLGIFTTNEQYRIALNMLWDMAEEEMQYGLVFAAEKIIPRVKNFEHYIDIGPGTGAITKVIGKNFKEITLVDINKSILSEIDAEMFPECQCLNKIECSILDTEMPEDTYDLLTLSHVLYYLPRETWLYIAQKAYKSLKKEGFMVIVLNDGGEKEKFLTYFGGEPFNFKKFIEDAKKVFGEDNIETFVLPAGVQTKEYEALLNIASFFLFDIQKTALRSEVEAYISEYVNPDHSGWYRMDSNQNFMIIRKN